MDKVDRIVLGLVEQHEFDKRSSSKTDKPTSSPAVVVIVDTIPQLRGETLAQQLKNPGQDIIYAEIISFPTFKVEAIVDRQSQQTHDPLRWIKTVSTQKASSEQSVQVLQRVFDEETAFRFIGQLRRIQKIFDTAESASFIHTMFQVGSHDTERLLADPNLPQSFRTAFGGGLRESSTDDSLHGPVLVPSPIHRNVPAISTNAHHNSLTDEAGDEIMQDYNDADL